MSSIPAPSPSPPAVGWSTDQDNLIRALAPRRTPLKDICKAVGRKPAITSMRIRALGFADYADPRFWTPEEDGKLRRLAAQTPPLTRQQIADALGRPPRAIESRAGRIRVKLPVAAPAPPAPRPKSRRREAPHPDPGDAIAQWLADNPKPDSDPLAEAIRLLRSRNFVILCTDKRYTVDSRPITPDQLLDMAHRHRRSP